jgi:RNA polymerase sigma-70 factor (ECF subfamily)
VDLESRHIQQVIDGDAASFTYLVTQYKDLAFAIAIRILQNEQDAEEAVQDAFVQAFRKIKNFRGESRFSTWLCSIVVNHSLTRARKRKRVVPYSDLEVAEGQIDAIDNSYRQLTPQEQTKYINLALERLAPEDRTLLTLYYLEEQPIGEIAEITGISKENTKMRLHRARGKMYGVLSKIMGR